MLSLYKLEIFAVVVQAGSFSSAAAQLHMSQPAVSQHIQDLERQLGISLFVRAGSRGVQATPAGEELYQYTTKILQLVREAEGKLTRIGELSEGSIRVGVTPGVSVYMLPRWIRAFRSQYPRLTISSQTSMTSVVVERIVSQHIDLGIIEGELDGSETQKIDMRTLRNIEMHVVVGRSHPWWQQEQIHLRDLHEQPFITRQDKSRTRQWIDQLLKARDVVPRIIAEFDNPDAIKHATITGMGVSLLPDYCVRHELEAGALRLLPVADAELKRHLKLIWRQGSPFSPPSRSFLQYLSDEFPVLRQLF